MCGADGTEVEDSLRSATYLHPKGQGNTSHTAKSGHRQKTWQPCRLGVRVERMWSLDLQVAPEEYAIYHFAPHEPVPSWAQTGRFWAMVSTPTEVSIICAAAAQRHAERIERGWRLIALLGSFAFTATGVLAFVLGPLAEASVSILAISTFDTDYVLVKEHSLPRAMEVLRACGHRVSVSGESTMA